jgi:hypothetical protein
MISDLQLTKQIGWSPVSPLKHETQLEILNAYNKGAEKIVVAAGVRGGKTAISSYLVLKTFLQGLEDIKAGKKDSIKIWVVAPNYELTQKVFEYVVKWFLKVYPDMAKTISYKPFPHIQLAAGVWIQCKSAENPNSLLGEEIDFCVIDEAAQVKREIWETYLFARLSSRRGKVIFISSPFGQNWFYDEFQRAKELGNAFHFRTLDNPYYPPEKYEEARKILPAQVFEQEYEASFLPDAAAVFRGIDLIIKDNCEQDVLASHRYVMGVDLGKHEDFTVLTVIDKYNNNVVYWDRFKDIDYPFQKSRIKATALRYNNARIVVDSTGVGEPIKDDLTREGLFVDDYHFTNKSKAELVEKLSISIEQKNVFIPNRQILIDELKSFGYKLTDSHNVIYSAPQGMHDDAVMSLALAVWDLVGKTNPKTAIQEELAKGKRLKRKDNFI